VTGFGHTHTTAGGTFPFLFYFIYFISPTATSLGRRLHHHLPVAEVAPHGRGPLAAGGQSARRSWHGPPFCAAVVGVVQRLLPHGMTWRNWGVVFPYYTNVLFVRAGNFLAQRGQTCLRRESDCSNKCRLAVSERSWVPNHMRPLTQ